MVYGNNIQKHTIQSNEGCMLVFVCALPHNLIDDITKHSVAISQHSICNKTVIMIELLPLSQQY